MLTLVWCILATGILTLYGVVVGITVHLFTKEFLMASFADFQAALDSFQSDVNVEFGKLGAQIDAEVGKANPAQDWQPAIDGVTSLKATVLAGVSALEAKIPA